MNSLMKSLFKKSLNKSNIIPSHREANLSRHIECREKWGKIIHLLDLVRSRV